MPDQERIRLMTKLAILEKENGRELRRIEESYRSDYIGIPMLKNTLRVTVAFLVILAVWMVCNVDFVLNIFTEGQMKLLLLGILAAYVTIILITWIVSFLYASMEYCRVQSLEQKYQELLKLLDERAPGSSDRNI